jgi:hypothetical protein
VGSNLLLAIVQAAGRPAIKTHNPRLELEDYDQWTLILLDRRDRFAALMSTMIMDHTGQYDHYDPICHDRWSVECDTKTSAFYITYWQLRTNYLLQHDFSRPYGRVMRMWYENYANNHNLVYKQLELSQSKPIKYPERSPYDYRKMIINWEECWHWFRIYENNTQESLDQYIKSGV